MIIQIEQVDIFSLPSVPVLECEKLPRKGGVYFVVYESKRMEYIGEAANLNKRWKRHCRFSDLESPEKSKIYWLEISDSKKRQEFEKRLIIHHHSRLNVRWNFGNYTGEPIKEKKPFGRIIFNSFGLQVFPKWDKDKFKNKRKRLGLTQSGFAEILGFASNTVSGYETGRLEVPKFMDLVMEALEARQIKELQNQSES